MKINFFHVLFAAALLLAIYSIHNYQQSMTPTWQATAAQQAAIDLQQAQQDARTAVQAHADRAEWFTNALSSFSGLAFALVLAGGAVYVWSIYDKRRESWARPVDGQYALQRIDQAGQTWTVDPNKSVFGVFGVDKRTGAITTDANMVGPDRQLAYAQEVQRTRTMAAMSGEGGIRNSSQAKFAAGFYERPRQLDYRVADEPAQLTNFKALTTEDAFSQSTMHKWILGQSKTGELFTIDPKESAHFGIVGATGAGKTGYAALMLMAIALKSKFRVVIADGKGGSDWSKYKDYTEYFSLDYSNVGGFTAQLTAEYEKRQAILNQYQVNSIWELKDKGVVLPRPTMILIDEFGACMDSLKAASKNEYKRVELELGNLLRLSRGCGLYVVISDQNPTKWPSTVRANLPMNVCFRLGGSAGNAVSEYNLDKLDRVGEFQVSGQRYTGFETFRVIDQLLPADYKKPKALLTVTSVTDNEMGGRVDPVLPAIPTPQRVTGNSDNTRVTTQEKGDNEGDNVPDNDNAVTSNITLSGAPVTTQEKQEVYRIYQALGKRKNATAKAIWGNAGGYLRYLNAVIAEYEQGETLQ